MKKVIFFLLTAFAAASCSDDCDHGISTGDLTSDYLVGSWYEETMGEENTYSASRTFYGKYCNAILQGEASGTYILNSETNRLTWSVTNNGSSMMTDWKLTDVSQYQFTMTSDVGISTYGRIVETITLNPGQSQAIAFNEQPVLGYESTRANVVTVTADGVVTSTGEKGTAYVKIKLQEGITAWAKVIVGANYADLWCDYSELFNQDVTAIRQLMGTPTKSQEFATDGYTAYTYRTSLHNILKYVNFSVDNTSHQTFEVDMYIKEGLPENDLLAYMDARYYHYTDLDDCKCYTTSPTLEESRAVYIYFPESKAVTAMTREEFFMQVSTDDGLDGFFGLTPAQVKTRMGWMGCDFIASHDNYSLNGSDAYAYSDFLNCYAVEFVYNPDGVVSQYELYMEASSAMAVLQYLINNYKPDSSEGNLVYYNDDRTLRIHYDMLQNTLVFTNTTLKAMEPVVLGTYWKALGKKKEEVMSDYGEEDFYEDDNGTIAYNRVFKDQYVSKVYFVRDSTTGEVEIVNVFVKDGVTADTVKSYLNKLYRSYESGNDDNGEYYRYINADSYDNADILITYYPEFGVVAYRRVK